MFFPSERKYDLTLINTDIRRGANWFHYTGLLFLINLILQFQFSIPTRIFYPGYFMAFTGLLPGTSYLTLQLVGIICLVFLYLFGYWSRKGQASMYLAGVIFLSLDFVLFFLFHPVFWGIAWHLFVLVMVILGYASLKRREKYLEKQEKENYENYLSP